jgi:hypothetical protein
VRRRTLGLIQIAGGQSEVIALLQLGAMGGMSFSMADAEVLPDKGTIAIREVASIDLLGSV